MQKQDALVFSPEVPPDLERASLIRDEAFDWLDTKAKEPLIQVTII